jgi:CheY-like chemotaxis protein/uncharacterized protein with PhoU and TrkA domain
MHSRRATPTWHAAFGKAMPPSTRWMSRSTRRPRASSRSASRSPATCALILSVFRISSNLERIGDYAKNIAKRSEAIMDHPPVNGTGASLKRMARQVELMLKDVLDAYIQRDPDLALDVRDRDIEVDQMYSALFREYLTFMMEDPRNITTCMHLHFMAKNIERMGDHATSIAEQVIYMVTGETPDEDRPKQEHLPVGRYRRADRGGNGTMAGEPLVLVVEDEPAQREVLAYNIRAEGYEVVTAEAGDEALVVVRETPPDVIILDWMLPNVSGIEVCRQLKMSGDTARIPVIMLSARSEETDKVRGLETGADDYIVKPYSVAELLARVRTQLGARARRRWANGWNSRTSSSIWPSTASIATG